MSVLDVLQLVSAVLLIIVILLQQRGTGLGSAFGGGDGNAYRTVRGLEKTLVVATVVLAVMFFGATLAHVLL